MRTTLDLPEERLLEAIKLTETKTKITKIKRYKGTIDIDIDVKALRDRGWRC